VVGVAQDGAQPAGREAAALEERARQEGGQRKEDEQGQARPQQDDGGQEGRVAPQRPRSVTPGD